VKVRNKVVVVTGAGSGLGREVALLMLRRGARVAAVDLRTEGLEQLAGLAQADQRLSTHVVDVTDRTQVEGLADVVVAQHGSVDAVVSCAGIIQPFVRIADLDYATMHRVMDVNYWGTVHVVKAFLPLLAARPQAHLATVASMGSFLPVPGQAAYGASKAAVKLLTEGLYAELLDTPVRVSVVLPGALATGIAANSGVAVPTSTEEGEAGTHRTLPAADAARVVVDGIEADRLHILVGRDARTMDAAMRTSPRRAIHLIQKRMRNLLPPAGGDSRG